MGVRYSCAHQRNKAKLPALKERAKEKLGLLRAHGNKILQCRKDTDAHLQAIKNEVDSTINEAKEIKKDIEQEDAAKINQETDEKNNKITKEIQERREIIRKMDEQKLERMDDKIQRNERLERRIQKMNDNIRKNDESRKERLELNSKNAEKRLESIDNTQRMLHLDIQTIGEEIERKIGELEKSWQDDIKTTEKIIQTLDRVIEEDSNILQYGHRVNTSSMTDELKKPLDEVGVKLITRIVSGVKFVKGVGREKYNGRIDGYDGEWNLVDTINVKDEIKWSRIVGCLGCHVIITGQSLGKSNANHTYMLDMNTKHIQRVITGIASSIISIKVESCALLNGDKVVCGKFHEFSRGDSLTGWISVYDRMLDKEWKVINNVTIPRNTTHEDAWVDVAVDQDGMIIAAERYQSKIYVINPADGKIINTISCKEKMRMRGVLSSGHIIATSSTREHGLFIIDRKGAHREIPHSHDSDVFRTVCIDPVTDDVYVMTTDDEYKTCMIDHVMSGGDIKKRRVASFPVISTMPMDRHALGVRLSASNVVMTSSGNMIASDGGDDILVFKKIFSL